MALVSRAVEQSPRNQGEDESIPYSLTTTPWLVAPTGIVVVVKDESNNYADVTSTVMPTNSPTVNGDVILLSPLRSLTAGHIYRVEIKFTAGGVTEETYLEIQAEK